MQVSYFETGRYYAPSNLPREWPMPAGAYDREAGLRAFRGMVERSRYVEELGFDWVSVSETSSRRSSSRRMQSRLGSGAAHYRTGQSCHPHRRT